MYCNVYVLVGKFCIFQERGYLGADGPPPAPCGPSRGARRCPRLRRSPSRRRPRQADRRPAAGGGATTPAARSLADRRPGHDNCCFIPDVSIWLRVKAHSRCQRGLQPKSGMAGTLSASGWLHLSGCTAMESSRYRRRTVAGRSQSHKY